MRSRSRLCPFILLLAPLAAHAQEPRVLLRLDGREETFGLLCCPQHAIAYYGVELLTDGSVRGAIDGWPGTLDRAGAPTFTLTSGRVAAATLRRITANLKAARIGFQRDCTLSPRVAFVFFASASQDPVQSFTWFGQGERRRRFDLDAGPPCGEPIGRVVEDLRAAFRDAPQGATAAEPP